MMNPKIKELVRKIETEKNTLMRLSLLEELDVIVTKIRKEEELKFKKERRI
jgi:hypothetical protein